MADRGRHPGEPTDRPEAHVEIEQLTERHVQRAEPAADRRGEGTLDPDQMLPEGLHCLIRQPIAGLVEGLLASEDLFPLDSLAVFGGGGVEHELRRGPYVDPYPIAFDEGDDRFVGDHE